MIKIMKFKVKNTETGVSSRVHYSRGDSLVLVDGVRIPMDCVTIYAKDYDNSLQEVFGKRTTNNSDTQTDYCEHSRVRIFPGEELWNDVVKFAR